MLGIFGSSYTTVSKGEESKANALVPADAETENVAAPDFENRSRGSSNSSAARSDSFVGRERTMTFSPAVPENSPTVLTFSNIVVQTKTDPPKVLLNNLSGSITGGFWAIMGSSGSGKTLLLSTLSLRLDANFMDIKGEIRLNGREFSRHTLKSMSAYVMQEDLLHAELTVQETLSYAARLRMARDTTAEERENRISEVLGLLGISHTRTVIIGNTVRKGVSGGERKRVSIAVELLNYPKLVFLDEPTTGLDSTTSLSVCEALKNFTVKGDCTVVCTIHQPQPKIFELFDNLILLKQGNMVYHGSARKTERFLQQMGLPCPADTAIADHLLDVISPTSDNSEVLNRTAAKRIVPVDLSLGKEKGSFDDSAARSWFVQFSILFQRNMHQYFRNSDVIIMNLIVTALLAIFIGSGLWFDIGTGQSSIAKRVPSLFFCCVTQGMVGSLQAINSFPAERAIMLRERQAGTYRVSAYFMAKTAVDILTALWPPILFTCIVYFMIGYQKRADKFFMFMFFMVLNALAPTSAATAVSCFCGSVDISVVVLSTVLEGCRLFGGFFASPAQIDDIPRWRFADALSYIKYAFVGVALNELSDLDIECNNPAGCAITSGQQIIKANGYDEYSTGYCIGILFVLIVGSRFLAYLGLRYIK